MPDSICKQPDCKPAKPYPDFPLYPHASKRWAKKIKGKTLFFGPWDSPEDALSKYEAHKAGEPTTKLARQSSVKPDKPYPDFPLYAHASGRWAKKIKGRTLFFGQWADWQSALERFQYENDYLQQGKTPPPRNQTALTVGELVNGMLEHRETKVSSGEMSQRTWDDYKRSGEMLIATLGRHVSVESLAPNDFAGLRNKLSKKMGLVALGNEIGRCRVFFNFAYKNQMVEKPVSMGLSFAKPTKKSLKREKQSKVAKVFSVDELRLLYHQADAQMKCFILLGIGGGMGNADIGQIEQRHIQGGWVVFPRPKTLVDRTFPLWPETEKSIRLARQTRHPELPYLFATKYGQAWHKDSASSPLSAEFKKLCEECEVYQEGRGFYALRHTFRTVADGCRDIVAINHVMGHSDHSMGENYREWIEPERLQAVVDFVYEWVRPMFRKPAKSKAGVK